MNNRSWNGRVFTSLCSLVSFILLSFTGIILYIVPHGRVAYWTRWSLFGLEKDQWGNIHIFSGLLFLVAGGFHLYYNWKPLIKYLSARIETGLHYKREILTTSLILLLIAISGIASLPPLAYVTDLGESIKSSWITAPELEPPFGHAELVSLKTFCKKQRIPLDQAITALKKAGFKVNTAGDTLAEIAASKATSGMAVYGAIKKLEPPVGRMNSGTTWTPEKIEETFAGSGLGRKTIGQLINDLGLDHEIAHNKLNKSGIKAHDNDKIKNLADQHNTTPINLVTRMLLGNAEAKN